MLQKDAFFNLRLVDQNRLRAFMILFSISQVLQYLFSTSPDSGMVVAKIVSISVILLFLYFAIFIARAPNFFFALITIPFWIVLIFDVSSVISSIIMNQPLFTFTGLLSLFKILLATIFVRSVMKYRRTVREAKKQNVTQQ